MGIKSITHTQTTGSTTSTPTTATTITSTVIPPTAALSTPLRRISTHNDVPPRTSARLSSRSTTPASSKRDPPPIPARLKPPPRRTLSTCATTTSPSNLTYHIAASYSPKQKPYEPAAMSFNFNPYNRVKIEVGGARNYEERKKARPDTGQDAFFVSRIGGSGGVAMGVADGVGGYSHYGIDSADFSHTLCENMALLAHNYTKPGGNLHPRTLLHNGYQLLLELKDVKGGASTACVGTIRPDGVLMVANLGDSGFLILRHGKVHYFSTPQTHAFNTPYQLSVVPPEVLDQSRLFGGDFLCDLPKDAQVTSHNLENGDVVVFATDGVWDNLFPSQVLQIVCQEMLGAGGWNLGPPNNNTDTNTTSTTTTTTSPTLKPGEQSIIAKAIAGKAKSASLNRHVDGPFAKEVRRVLPGEEFRGGKRDDICVVVGVVVGEV
ncbi:phosphatase 2C-like domain-containing protein [Terfezia claveryi]|nr:phosphatase 2C-like domain-containing protein [Terfezia claveryi]